MVADGEGVAWVVGEAHGVGHLVIEALLESLGGLGRRGGFR